MVLSALHLLNHHMTHLVRGIELCIHLVGHHWRWLHHWYRRDRCWNYGCLLLLLLGLDLDLASIGSSQIRRVISFIHIVAIVLIVGEAFSDEVFAGLRNLGFSGEDDLSCVQDCLVLEDSLLGFVVTKGFLSEEDLKKDNTDAPYVNLKRYKGQLQDYLLLNLSWEDWNLTFQSIRALNTSRCQHLKMSTLFFHSSHPLFCKDRSLLSSPLRCGTRYSEALSRSEWSSAFGHSNT